MDEENKKNRYKFYWEPTEDGGARLLRAFGEHPFVSLPQSVDGVLLTEIGDYCFAKTSRLPADYRVTETAGTTALHEISGSYLKAIVLPDGIKRIGSFAFYNCTSLERLELGKNMKETGGDAFMNCRNFHWLNVRCGIKEPSGIRPILNQISADIQVTFTTGKTEAVLLFPEYYESYDEVAPAHLFGRNIEGEGFRARQCFRDGYMDFRQYDTIFPKACNVENENTLCDLAMNRLRYPIDLDEEWEQLYRAYINGHAAKICCDAIQNKETQTVAFLCENHLADKAALEEAIRTAAQLEWVEGTAQILTLKEKYFPLKTVQERYAFDDF